MYVAHTPGKTICPISSPTHQTHTTPAESLVIPRLGPKPLCRISIPLQWPSPSSHTHTHTPHRLKALCFAAEVPSLSAASVFHCSGHLPRLTHTHTHTRHEIGHI